jgi:hypothetical protein
MSPKLLVYGATGLVGGHIVRTAVGWGLQTSYIPGIGMISTISTHAPGII